MARPRSSKKKKTLQQRLLGVLKWLVIVGVLAGITGVAGLAGIFYYYGRDLPELLEREDYDPPQLSQILTADGEVIAEFHVPGERRTLVPLEEIPPVVQEAFLAAEDSEFMSHDGIDYLGMLRAVYYAFRHDQGMRGTSTITQQLIKNITLSPERAYERKIQEIILARELEKNLTKEDILYMYLNTIYLGHGIHGVQEASRFYFGKDVDKLEVHEAALLAGLTSGPEGSSPLRNMDRAHQRRSFTLRQMWEKGFINEGTYREALETEIETVPRSETYPHVGKAPYFADHVRRIIVEEYGSDMLFEGGLRVYTTLRLDHQESAEKAARRGLREYDARQTFFRPTGQISEDDIDDFIAASQDDVGTTLEPTEVYEGLITSVDADSEEVIVQIGSFETTLLLEPRTRILGEGSEKKSVDEALARGDIVRVRPRETVTASTEAPREVRFEPGAEAAVITIDPETREVTALVGGYDFELNEYNSATQARRQTGSAFKTLVYAAALDSRVVTPASIYLDSPTVFQMYDGTDWSPRNADGQWRGAITVREALSSSRNVVAVRVLDDLGIDEAIDFAKRIGVRGELVRNHTMVMGSSELTPLEITNTYATFAAYGNYAEPRFIKRVESVRGEREIFQTHSEPVLAPEVAYLTTSLLVSAVHGYTDSSGNRRGGTGHNIANLGHTFAGKTGTTNDSRDAWFIGYTPDLVTGVWVGFGDNRSLGRRQYGGNVAAPIFGYHKERLLADREEPLQFEPPRSGITTATIDPTNGKLARGGGIEEEFLVGTAPTQYAPEEDEDTGESFFLNQFQDDPEPEEEPEPVLGADTDDDAVDTGGAVDLPENSN